MPYIGNTIRAADDYRLIDDISSGFNGSETSFALQVAGSAPVPFPKSPQQVLISVNGVIQEPDPTGASGFNLVGTNIVFSSAPTNGHAFFGIIYATADYLNAGGNFPSGSLGAPSVTFVNDENTGLYRKGSGSVGFVSDATEIANFDSNGITISSGNLIIPGDIIHSGDTNTKIRFSDTDQIKLETGSVQKLRLDNTEVVVNDDGADIDFRVEGDTDTNLIRTDAGTDHVGIGTPAARAKFEVFDSSVSAAFSATDLSTWRVLQVRNNIESNTGTAAGIAFGGDGSSDTETAGICGISGNNTGGVVDLAFLTATGNASTERMRILSGGNVGIGITNPANTLHLDSSSGAVIQLQRTSVNASNRLLISHDGTDGTIESSNALLFRNNGAERMRLDSSGRLMIGTTTEGVSTGDDLTIATSGNTGITIRSGTASNGNIFFSDGTTGNAELEGYIQYDHSGNYMRFATDATERMRIDSSGRVGIGVTPATVLHVRANTGDLLRLDRDNQGSVGNQIAFRHKDAGSAYVETGSINCVSSTNAADGNLRFSTKSSGGSNTEKLRITEAGDVGIGTTSPAANLHIKDGSGNTEIKLQGGASTANDVIAFLNSAGSTRGNITYDTDNDFILFNVGTAERLRIDSAGNVGIQNINPSGFHSSGHDLVIGSGVGDEGMTIYSGTGDAGVINFADGTSGSQSYMGRILYRHNDNAMSFHTNTGSERMRIDSSGRVGIGLTSPAYTLNVKGGSVDQVARFENSKTSNGDINYIGVSLDGGGRGVALFGHSGHTTSTSQAAWMGLAGDDVAGGVGVRVFRTGKVNMGNTGTSNNATLSVRGAGVSPISCLCNSTSGHTQIFFVNPNGNVGQINTISSETRYFTTSDYRLKENVVDLTGAITRLKTLQPKRFNWISDETNTLRDGFLAHEVTAVPEAISGIKDAVAVEDDVNRGLAEAIGDPIYQNIDNSKLVPLLTAALQEAITKIETLETKVAALEAA